MKLSFFLAGLCVLLAVPTACGDSATGGAECGAAEVAGPSCEAGDVCVWTSDQQTECLPRCETPNDCGADETCHAPDFGRLTASEGACFPRALLELPSTEAEQQALQQDCRARTPEDCVRNPRCFSEFASKLDLEAQCYRPEVVGCFATGTLCDLSVFIAEDSEGALFIFIAGCGNPDFSPLSLQLDDPLQQLLFEGDTNAFEWPICD